MPFLQRTFNFFKSVFARSESPLEDESEIAEEQYGGTNWVGPLGGSSEKHAQRVTGFDRSRKRKALGETQPQTQKRARTDTDEPGRKSLDRDLMPPPTATNCRKSLLGLDKGIQADTLDTPGSVSESQIHKTRPTEIEDEFDMEDVRRKVAETPLPPGLSTWEPGERELFWHLNRRGTEPLLPKNWMVDFGTLPINLFAFFSDQTPLIQPHRSNEFPAIRALRELLDIGQTVRDRTLSKVDLRMEPILERAVKKYIKWAMKDIGISSKQCIPVHAIATKKPGQNAHDTIRELTIRMHKLSARHRAACNILTSIERDDIVCNDQDNERCFDDDAESEHRLPTIYGLVITASIIGVFTLSSHVPPPRFLRSSSNSPDDREDDDNDSDFAPRFIEQFDFSKSTSDVWNAFVIAIFAMMVRKTLLDVYDIPTVNDAQDYDESVLESSMIDGSLDERRETYLTRYAAGSQTHSVNGTRPVLRVEEDPELDPDL